MFELTVLFKHEMIGLLPNIYSNFAFWVELRINRVRINRVRINRVRINRVRINRVRINRVRINRVRINRSRPVYVDK